MKNSSFEDNNFLRSIAKKLFSGIEYEDGKPIGGDFSLQDIIWLYKNSSLINSSLRRYVFDVVFDKIRRSSGLNHPINNFESKVFEEAVRMIYSSGSKNRFCISKLDAKYALCLSEDSSYVKVKRNDYGWDKYEEQIILNLKESWNEKKSV